MCVQRLPADVEVGGGQAGGAGTAAGVPERDEFPRTAQGQAAAGDGQVMIEGHLLSTVVVNRVLDGLVGRKGLNCVGF